MGSPGRPPGRKNSTRDALVLKAHVRGKPGQVVLVRVTDLDGFIHAAPTEYVVVGNEEDQLGQVRKCDLIDFEVCED